jgi:RND family efflux transporter MFP subunit
MLITRLPACLVPALALISAFGCGAEEGRRRPADGERLPRAEVVRPAYAETLARRVDLTATVEPLEKADLCARVPGVVSYLPGHVDIGYAVKEGEELVRLDVPDLAALKEQKAALRDLADEQLALVRRTRQVLEKEAEEAERQEERYRAEMRARADEHARVQRLVERDAQAPEVAREKLGFKEAAEAAWQAARAQVAVKRAKLDANDAEEKVARARVKAAHADVAAAEAQLGLAVLKAPFPGVVTKRWVDRGATVKDAGAPLLTLMRTDTVRVLLDVPDRDAVFVRSAEQAPDSDGKGSRVTLRFPSLLERGLRGDFPDEHVKRLAGARDGSTRTMRAEVHLSNPSGLVQPNTFGQASLLLEERKNVYTIPPGALVRQGDAFKVLYLADAQGDPPRGVVREAEVRLGLDDGRQVQLIAGVPLDAWIVARSNGALRPGDTVVGVPTRRP